MRLPWLFHKAFRLFDVKGCSVIISTEDFSTELYGANVVFKYDRWPSEKGFNIVFTISRP